MFPHVISSSCSKELTIRNTNIHMPYLFFHLLYTGFQPFLALSPAKGVCFLGLLVFGQLEAVHPTWQTQAPPGSCRLHHHLLRLVTVLNHESISRASLLHRKSTSENKILISINPSPSCQLVMPFRIGEEYAEGGKCAFWKKNESRIGLSVLCWTSLLWFAFAFTVQECCWQSCVTLKSPGGVVIVQEQKEKP